MSDINNVMTTFVLSLAGLSYVMTMSTTMHFFFEISNL